VSQIREVGSTSHLHGPIPLTFLLPPEPPSQAKSLKTKQKALHRTRKTPSLPSEARLGEVSRESWTLWETRSVHLVKALSGPCRVSATGWAVRSSSREVRLERERVRLEICLRGGRVKVGQTIEEEESVRCSAN
jgi:hypothetical protein